LRPLREPQISHGLRILLIKGFIVLGCSNQCQICRTGGGKERFVQRGYGKLKRQGRLILKTYKGVLKALMDTDPLKSYFLYVIINWANGLYCASIHSSSKLFHFSIDT
jgi:hypothetical protein